MCYMYLKEQKWYSVGILCLKIEIAWWLFYWLSHIFAWLLFGIHWSKFVIVHHFPFYWMFFWYSRTIDLIGLWSSLRKIFLTKTAFYDKIDLIPWNHFASLSVSWPSQRLKFHLQIFPGDYFSLKAIELFVVWVWNLIDPNYKNSVSRVFVHRPGLAYI